MPDTTDTELVCLNCGQTRSWAKSHPDWLCCITSGGEYEEVDMHWPRHHWKPWTNTELDRAGLRAEAYEKHRRTTRADLDWIGCDDTKRGHSIIDTVEDRDFFGVRIGQCLICGHQAVDTTAGSARA